MIHRCTRANHPFCVRDWKKISFDWVQKKAGLHKCVSPHSCKPAVFCTLLKFYFSPNEYKTTSVAQLGEKEKTRDQSRSSRRLGGLKVGRKSEKWEIVVDGFLKEGKGECVC